MKKFASLLLTAVLLAAMLTVFAVPVSAEETPEELMSKGMQYERDEDYVSAAEAYMNAGATYENLASQYDEQGDFAAAADIQIKSADAYYNAAQMFEEANDHATEAEDAYIKASWFYFHSAQDYQDFLDNRSVANAFDHAATCDIKLGKMPSAASDFSFAARWYKNVDLFVAANKYIESASCYAKTPLSHDAGNAFFDAASIYEELGISDSAGFAYLAAAEFFLKDNDKLSASSTFFYAEQLLNDNFPHYAEAARSGMADAGMQSWTGGLGSVLSEGSWTIICTIAALALGLGGGFFIGMKKKMKPAVADGTDNTDEE